jgi:cell division protein FtsN
MDVGFYLGELLMQQNEVSVPGLGYFALTRMSSYYDENRGRFYPPHHQVQFDTQTIDDDDLAEYIARKKNISVASAKYFTEKYISDLKQEALTGMFAIGNLGWFYTDNDQLAFKPANKIVDDTIFYGYEAIQINKTGGLQVHEEPDEPKKEFTFFQKPVEPEETAKEEFTEAEDALIEAPQVDIDEKIRELKEQNATEEVYTEYEEEETGKARRLWIIAIIILVLLGGGLFALYQYNPSIFNVRNTPVGDTVKHKTIVPKPDSVKNDTAKTDTAKTNSVKTVAPDTVAKVKTVAPAAVEAAETFTTTRYEVIVANCNDTTAAMSIIQKLKGRGLDAKIVANAPGHAIMVSAGTYKTFSAAKSAAVNLINTGKIRSDAYPIEIKPKK